VDAAEVRKLAKLEDRHWWYQERRHLLAKAVAGLPRGIALDIGSAGGGNTRVLRSLGWQALSLDFDAGGAQVARERGLSSLRGDARSLPLADDSVDLVVAFDILEHFDEDWLAAREIRRVLRAGGTLLVAVPADPALWSAHDVAVGHVRRYTRETLTELLRGNGFAIESMRSWNVLLRPVAAMRRRRSVGSDLDEVHPVVNFGLRAVVGAERHLPLRNRRGISLLVTARPR
jgi:SAM-dependent methyltransferase